MTTETKLSRDDLQSMANDAGCAEDIFSSNLSPSDTFNYIVSAIAGAILIKSPAGAITLGMIISIEENRKYLFEQVIDEMKDNDYDYFVATTSYELTSYDETSVLPNYTATDVTYSYSN